MTKSEQSGFKLDKAQRANEPEFVVSRTGIVHRFFESGVTTAKTFCGLDANYMDGVTRPFAISSSERGRFCSRCNRIRPIGGK